MTLGLVRLVASRYLRSRRRSGGSRSAVLSIIGVGVGVMTLTVVLAVMNGFQLGFIESIVELASYHLQCTGAGAGEVPVDRLVEGVPGVRAAVPFAERQVLLQGPYSRPRPCVIRAVPPDLLSRDPTQASHLTMVEGSFSVGGKSDIVIGVELAAWLGAGAGDVVTVTWLGSGPRGEAVPRSEAMVVTGVYRSGYFDFDDGMLNFAALVPGGIAAGAPQRWGIKLADRFADGPALEAVSARLAGTGLTVRSWRQYNRGFFDALLVEKLLMLILVGLIFVVVGFNTYHSLRRAVLERAEDIAVLKAMGVPPSLVQYVFTCEGLAIGIVGALSGISLGLAIAGNVDWVFAAVEDVVNGAMALVGAAGAFAIFSPTSFYLVSVPSRVLPREAFLVAFLAILSCTLAAWTASRAVARYRPAEVLRYE